MTQEAVRRSLIEQLRANGADIDVFRGLISDYLAMFGVCEKLKADIKKRGTIVKVSTPRGEILQTNSSIKELRDTNKSMLAILKQLNLSIDTVQPTEDDRL